MTGTTDDGSDSETRAARPAGADARVPAPGPALAADDDGSALGTGFARYRDFEEIGSGGTGFIRSCVDPNLGRRVALKMLHPELQDDPDQRRRFLREVRVMARIEHPSIVPVHEVGAREEDGGLYFTMKQVKGASLQDVLGRLQAKDPEYRRLYPRERILSVFVQTCQAVAFAHAHGVIHRDLKPQNILIGDFGEVQIMDWGLVKAIGGDENGVASTAAAALGVDEALGDGLTTVDGQIAGTPRYMAPEQALGHVSQLDGRSDVYSLGAILYEMLTLQHYVSGDTVREILPHVIKTMPRSPRKRAPHLRIPRELDAICMKCLAKAEADRYQSVAALIADLEHFRAGHPVAAYTDTHWDKLRKWCRRHPVKSTAASVALVVTLVGVTATGLARHIRYRMLMGAADRFRQEGNQVITEKIRRYRQLEALRSSRVVKDRMPRETELEQAVSDLHLAAENKYQTAVILYAQAGGRFDERKRRAFSQIFSRQLQYALLSRNYTEFKRLLNFLRSWLGQDFEHATPGDRQWLLGVAAAFRGDGRLEVVSRPPGAKVQLVRLEATDGKVLTSSNARDLGVTPVSPVTLPQGRYLLTLKLPGRAEVIYPVRIDYGEHEQASVLIPAQVPPGMVYVPAGPFYSGGRHADYYRLHERVLPGFFIRQTEVTMAEYLEFWKALPAAARQPDLVARVHVSGSGRDLTDAWNSAGDLITGVSPDLPVFGITHSAAGRYCEWLSKRRGLACRLPTAREWEKAARGVDGREYVWGDVWDPTFTLIQENVAARQQYAYFAPGGAFPLDCSVYGALDLAGNVREWTADALIEGSRLHKIKGASALTTRRFLPCAQSSETPGVSVDVGFRYVVALQEESDAE